MLWGTHWASLYSPESTSHHIISHIQNTYYLVNLVDNDFVTGNVLFQVGSPIVGVLRLSHTCVKNITVKRQFLCLSLFLLHSPLLLFSIYLSQLGPKNDPDDENSVGCLYSHSSNQFFSRNYVPMFRLELGSFVHALILPVHNLPFFSVPFSPLSCSLSLSLTLSLLSSLSLSLLSSPLLSSPLLSSPSW